MTERANGFDASRAELFEALGHPARVRILHALETRPLGFAELKREVGIESSGHLQFHLGKLTGLVGTTSEGSYALTDDGRDALGVLKSVPTNHGEGIPKAKSIVLGRSDWTRPLLAILLISIVALAGVAVYQQEQIATVGRELSAATVSLGGTSYYYETVPIPSNGSVLQFHGVTFTILGMSNPSYSNPNNYTYAGSVRLTNGTLLNLTGKTVIVEVHIICQLVQTIGENSTGVHYGYCFPGVGISMTFPDGGQSVHPGYNLTARHQNAYDGITTQFTY